MLLHDNHGSRQSRRSATELRWRFLRELLLQQIGSLSVGGVLVLMAHQGVLLRVVETHRAPRYMAAQYWGRQGAATASAGRSKPRVIGVQVLHQTGNRFLGL